MIIETHLFISFSSSYSSQNRNLMDSFHEIRSLELLIDKLNACLLSLIEVTVLIMKWRKKQLRDYEGGLFPLEIQNDHNINYSNDENI